MLSTLTDGIRSLLTAMKITDGLRMQTSTAFQPADKRANHTHNKRLLRFPTKA